MGKVAVIVRVMPESPEVDLEKLKSALKQKLPGIQDIQEEPIGFGLKALKLAAMSTTPVARRMQLRDN